MKLPNVTELEDRDLLANGYHLTCRAPSWWDRMRGRDHDASCLACACRQELRRRGWDEPTRLPGGTFRLDRSAQEARP